MAVITRPQLLRGASLSLALLLTACTRREFDVELPLMPPGGDPLAAAKERPEVVINIDPYGSRVVMDANYNSDAALKQLLTQVLAHAPQTSILIRADRRAPYESVMTVLGLARNAGYSKVAFSMKISDDSLDERQMVLHY